MSLLLSAFFQFCDSLSGTGAALVSLFKQGSGRAEEQHPQHCCGQGLVAGGWAETGSWAMGRYGEASKWQAGTWVPSGLWHIPQIPARHDKITKRGRNHHLLASPYRKQCSPLPPGHEEAQRIMEDFAVMPPGYLYFPSLDDPFLS